MAKLIYSGNTSLDGYVTDADGNFDWSEPDEEVHSFINALERPVGTYLYGRRMYDVMTFWETITAAEQPPFAKDYSDSWRTILLDYAEIWRAAEKIVYSTTLAAVSSDRTRIEREFDPDSIRRLKSASARDIGVGGAELAAQAIEAGLVDEYHLFISPVVVGGGTQFLPDGVRLSLELVDEHRFGNGVMHLHYRARA